MGEIVTSSTHDDLPLWSTHWMSRFVGLNMKRWDSGPADILAHSPIDFTNDCYQCPWADWEMIVVISLLRCMRNIHKYICFEILPADTDHINAYGRTDISQPLGLDLALKRNMCLLQSRWESSNHSGPLMPKNHHSCSCYCGRKWRDFMLWKDEEKTKGTKPSGFWQVKYVWLVSRILFYSYVLKHLERLTCISGSILALVLLHQHSLSSRSSFAKSEGRPRFLFSSSDKGQENIFPITFMKADQSSCWILTWCSHQDGLVCCTTRVEEQTSSGE